MKLAILASVAFMVANAFAQSFNFVAPPVDASVTAGATFPVSLAFHPNSASVKLLTLYYGFDTAIGPFDEELGDELALVFSPTFTNVGGTLVNNVNLTIPTGITGQINLTCGIFYTLGVQNFPQTQVVRSRVIVS